MRVTRGAVLDVAVDIRKGSPTYGRHVAVVLSAGNWKQIWVPKGFAHGFCTLDPETEVLYKVTDYYAADCDRGLKLNDRALGIDWGIAEQDAILSEKDRCQPGLSQLPDYFIYGS